MSRMATRDLVRDNYARLGVVVRREPLPDQAWLEAQEREALRPADAPQRSGLIAASLADSALPSRGATPHLPRRVGRISRHCTDRLLPDRRLGRSSMCRSPWNHTRGLVRRAPLRCPPRCPSPAPRRGRGVVDRAHLPGVRHLYRPSSKLAARRGRALGAGGPASTSPGHANLLRGRANRARKSKASE